MEDISLVSIIIPVFNAEKYIEESILSVINQTYKNIEIICIDDASTDNSYNVCISQKEKFSNIKVYRNIDQNGKIATKNCGQESARNYGLKKATGKYILFLDADDIIEYEMIYKLVSAAQHNNTDITICTYSQIIGKKIIPYYVNINEGYKEVSEFIKYIFNEISWSILSCIGSKLYKLDFIKENNITFDKKYKFNEDCAFFLTTLFYANSIYFINEPYYKYFYRTNSTMTSYRKDMFITNVCVVELCKKLFTKYNCWEVKKNDYYQKLYYLMIDSLSNEVKFSKTKSFIKTSNQIYNYFDFKLAYKTLKKSNKLPFKHKISFYLLMKKHFIILYFLILFSKYSYIKSFFRKIHYYFWTRFYKIVYSIKSENSNKVYMFHNITDGQTNIKTYCSNYKSFEKFIQEKLQSEIPLPISEIMCIKHTLGFSITFDDGFAGVYDYAVPILEKYNIPFTVFITYNYIGKDGYMTKAQIIDLSKKSLCTIGAHTISHPLLRFCKDADYEILESKKRIEKLINKPIEMFSYPYGSAYACCQQNIKFVKKSGFLYAFSAINGCLNKFARTQIYFLPRINGDLLVKKFDKEISK